MQTFNIVFLYVQEYSNERSWKVSLIKHKATGSSASLLHVLWVPFLENKHCMCILCEEQKIMWTSGLQEALPKQQF